MKTKASRRGFTLIELLVVVSIIAMMAGGAYLGYSSLLPGFRARQAATQARVIHGWLIGYANEHGGSFPEGESSNEAYRQLFKGSLGADEKQFAISGEVTHRAAPGGGPDGDTGTAPDFAQALEAGECGYAYVSGLSSSDTARLPLIANAFSATPGVWSKRKNEIGGVFQGRYGVVCRVGGSALAHEISAADPCVKEKYNGQLMNIFTPGYEDMSFTVVNPLR